MTATYMEITDEGLVVDVENSDVGKRVEKYVDDAISTAACMSCVAVAFLLLFYVYLELQKPPPDWLENSGP